jgi:[protein-PII] uridylyltransferase
VQRVVDALGGDSVLLELLHALAEADSIATGPGVWGEWKSSLIGELVRRCRLLMAGEPLPQPDPVDPALLELAADGQVHVDQLPAEGQHTYRVTVVAPDATGLLSDAAGVLALHSLRVLAASVRSEGGYAVNSFQVSPRFGSLPEPGLLRQDLIRAIGGHLNLDKELVKKERDAAALQSGGGRGKGGPMLYAQAPPKLIWFDGTQPDEVLLEVRAEDRVGLLSRVAGALEQVGADVRWAKVATLGAAVMDTFALQIADGDSAAARARVEAAVLEVLPQTAPKLPPPEAG